MDSGSQLPRPSGQSALRRRDTWPDSPMGHRQFLRDKLPQLPLAPGTDVKFEAQFFGILFGVCFVVPSLAFWGLWRSGNYAWALPTATALQVVFGIMALIWTIARSPHFDALDVAITLANNFRTQFGVQAPATENVEAVLAELDQPAWTTLQLVTDGIVADAPVKWLVLLLFAALGPVVLPLLGMEDKGQGDSVRLLAFGLGLAFGTLALGRTVQRSWHRQRLLAAREWLRQLREQGTT